jgi:TatD DNase family protein
MDGEGESSFHLWLGMLIDTHCHLQDPPLSDDSDGVLARARAAGVTALVVPGGDLPTSRAAIALAARHDDVWAAVGLHPHNLDDSPYDEAALEALVTAPRVVAVGEIGLDGAIDAPMPRQIEVLDAQLRMARRHDLPVLLHGRGAHQPLFELLHDHGVNPAGGVLHAWNGSPEMARQLAALGYLVGVGGVATRPRAARVRRMVAALPLELLVLETDAPYIGTARSPGGAVEPAELPLVAAAVAELHGLPVEDIARVTSATARRRFRIEEVP